MEIIMKKNILSVIIAALTVVNVVLTAIMFFVMLPTFQKTNKLITDVASVLNLELETDKSASGDADYTIKDLSSSPVAFESTQTLNLGSGKDGNQHYAKLDGYTLSLNTKAKDYKDMSTTITSNESQITGIVREVIQSHTIDDISESKIDKEIVQKIQKYLGSKVVVSVTLTNFVYM
jgi:flagellar basal body-associated protein FliL